MQFVAQKMLMQFYEVQAINSQLSSWLLNYGPILSIYEMDNSFVLNLYGTFVQTYMYCLCCIHMTIHGELGGFIFVDTTLESLKSNFISMFYNS